MPGCFLFIHAIIKGLEGIIDRKEEGESAMQLNHKENLDRGERLPLSYSEDCLVLLPRDPRWIFAYWEVSPLTRRSIEQQAGAGWDGNRTILRVFRFEAGQEHGEEFFDITPGPLAKSWYIEVGVPGRGYQVELGYVMPDGRYELILASNKVTTPRDRLSDILDEKWRLPDWQARKLYRRIALSHLSSPERLRQEAALAPFYRDGRGDKILQS